ncbi:MAG TPA: 30S ribosomal protein S9 [Bacteroides sp.]|nr:30S ribosomal protein S9 [Bacteroides sp.]
MEVINTIGRRKAAIARIYMSEGKGQIIVNDKDYKTYFPHTKLHYIVEQPLNLLELKNNYDIRVNLNGGGMSGQAEALRLAISRALVKVNPEYKTMLKAEGFMTRDPRVIERKKPGQPKARKRFQFSKR